ncbi:MAG: DUF2179 domain-containing protein [Deltaproteobacteria bacterium]
MEEILIFESNIFNVILVSLLVFTARTLDVSIGTVRIIFVSRGRKLPAALCGFFETLIWLFAVGQILQNLTNPLYYIAFGAGFATGTYMGILLEEKLAMGMLIVRIITKREATMTLHNLRESGFGVTSLKAEGKDGPVNIFYTVVKRADLEQVLGIIKKFNDKAFYTIEDVRFMSEPIKPPPLFLAREHYLGLRKGK